MPYYDQLYNNLNKELSQFLTKNFPQLDISLIFENNLKILSFVSHKDKIPLELCSSVVYKYTCDCCKAIYIGSTLRQFAARRAEHLGVSSRTAKPTTTPPHSNIRNHATQLKHPISDSQFSIMTNTKSQPHELRILESLYIYTQY